MHNYDFSAAELRELYYLFFNNTACYTNGVTFARLLAGSA